MATISSSLNYILPFSSMVCNLSSRFANTKYLSHAAIIYQLAETSLVYLESKSVNFHFFAKKIKFIFLPKFLRSESILDKFFIAANITSSLWTFGKLAELINQNTKLSILGFWKNKNISPFQFGTSLIPFALALLALSSISYFGAKAGNVLLNREKPEEMYKEAHGALPENTKIRRIYPFEQNLLNSFRVVRLSMTIALTIFSKEKLFFGINAACELLSWAQTTKRKKYLVEKVFYTPEEQLHPDINKYVFKFSFRAYEFPKKKDIRYTCAFESARTQKQPLDYNICYEHFAHITCIFKSIIEKIDGYKNTVSILSKSHGTLNRPRPIKLNHTCSSCRKTPFFQKFIFEIHDKKGIDSFTPDIN